MKISEVLRRAAELLYQEKANSWLWAIDCMRIADDESQAKAFHFALTFMGQEAIGSWALDKEIKTLMLLLIAAAAEAEGE